jgi:hypothetical protein
MRKEIVMRNRKSRLRGLIAAGLLALLVVRVVPASTTVRSAAVPVVAASSTATPSAPAEAYMGKGFWETLACVGCATAILAAGGTSVPGLAIIAGLYPEAVAACGLACYVAFSG